MSHAADDHVNSAILRFDEALNRAGFQTEKCGDLPEQWQWRGRVGVDREPAIVQLTSDFPFASPTVVLPRRSSTVDWHKMPGGALCLWSEHSKGDLPWLDGVGLVERVEEWISCANGGWTQDMPQLDLEAYNNRWFEMRDSRVFAPVLFVESWAEIEGGWFQISPPDNYGVMKVIKTGLPEPIFPERSRNSARQHSSTGRRARTNKYVNAVAIDLGQVTEPFVFTEQIAESAGANTPLVVRILDSGRPVVFVAKYSRDNAEGFLGFWFEVGKDGDVRRCFPVAERRQAQQRRAGWHAESLAGRKVSVVGAGSIGSHLADLLHRSGVTHLTVHDSDELLPGNLSRHAASPAFAGRLKSAAVKETANLRTPEHPIQTAPAIRGIREAIRLLGDQDLVIDCTGDRLTWQLFLAAAAATGRSFLHVAVVGHGQVARVDICPPLNGAASMAEVDVLPVQASAWESGCGDPVSPTPPIAVAETAAMGARIAIRLLAGESVSPGGESRVLFPVAK